MQYLLYLTLFFASASFVHAKPYDLKDLEVLESNKDYREFLDHAMDVRPSQRQEPWPQMVKSMAGGYLDFLTGRQNFDRELFYYIENLSTWPVLREDEFFHLKWQRYGLRSARHCIASADKEQNKACMDLLTRLWNSTLKNPDFALQVAELVRGIDPQADLWKYYQHSAKSSFVSQYHCAQKEVKRWAFRAVHEKIQANDLHGKSLKNTINSLMHEDCWKHLSSDLKRMIMSSSSLKKSAYLSLEAMDDLTQEETDKFLVRYFLEGPEIGRVFNQSWNQVKEISRHSNRREKVLDYLLTLDPLPGKIFKLGDLASKQTMLNHLSTFFPEYIDSYVRTCLDYREGIRDFAQGNPTIECMTLIETQKETNSRWIDQGLILRYSGREF